MAIDRPKTLAEELYAASGVKPDKFKGKPRQKLLEAVLEEIGDLTDEEWKQLSPKAQAWYNSNFDDKTEKQKNTLTDFETPPAAATAAKASTPAKSATPAKPGKPAASQPTKPPAKVNGSATVHAKSKPGGRGETARTIQRLALKHPDLSAQAINEKLRDRKIKVSDMVVSAIRSHFRQAVEVLREAGELKHKDLEV